ncbi:MAG: hypothetical protein KIT84_37565 [Labilithrix sp.]|nr:hypothetical protein [Labilithrix sp.]MCW5816768.1 hypothetical protein [Labilithrix sp.]
MNRTASLFVLGFLSLVACTKAYPKAPVDPRNVDGPVDCAPEELKANEKCFAHAKDACDSLGCAEGCDIHRSRTSKWVTCSSNRASSSMLTRCDGIAGWQCPEDMVCADDPRPGACKAANALDCTGVCVTIARCEGYSGWACPEGMVCADDPRPGACSRERDDDCAGICVRETRTNRRPAPTRP